jgi:hypothetical protein
MIGAGPARWFVLLVGSGLACQRARTEGAVGEGERSRYESQGEREAGGHAPAAVVTARSTEQAAPVMRPSEPVGGRWVSCYANYRPTSAPERDVARIAASCGPENGMVPVGPVVSGDAVDASEDHRLEAGAGDCFRIFAVADAFVPDLGVEVISPRGKAVTWDRNGDRWPVLNPDGPFCLFDAGTYTVRVRALQGKGRYALQIWRLP